MDWKVFFICLNLFRPLLSENRGIFQQKEEEEMKKKGREIAMIIDQNKIKSHLFHIAILRIFFLSNVSRFHCQRSLQLVKKI